MRRAVAGTTRNQRRGPRATTPLQHHQAAKRGRLVQNQTGSPMSGPEARRAGLGSQCPWRWQSSKTRFALRSPVQMSRRSLYDRPSEESDRCSLLPDLRPDGTNRATLGRSLSPFRERIRASGIHRVPVALPPSLLSSGSRSSIARGTYGAVLMTSSPVDPEWSSGRGATF